ncbi:MAG: CHASE domain-containing protein [Planctomycetaceae bacterium]|nr:CHASE domain-containing protein [Planctomycetaceae bacterium]
MQAPSDNSWEYRIRRLAARHRWLSTGLPTVAVGIVTVLLSIRVHQLESERIDQQFQTDAQQMADRLNDRIALHQETIRSISSLYRASHEVSRTEFDRFVASALESQNMIQALEWIPRVSAAQRQSFEAAVRAEGLPEFRLKRRLDDNHWAGEETAWADEYFPVCFISPLRGNEHALGIDLGSCPIRRQAIERARDTGLPTATAPVVLARAEQSVPALPSGDARADEASEPNPGDSLGVLLFVPIYRNDQPTETIEQRRENLVGFALGVTRIPDLIRSAFSESASSEMALQVRDRDGVLICEIGRQPSGTSTSSSFTQTADCSIGGTNWSLNFTSLPTWVRAQRGNTAGFLAFGGALVVLLVFTVLQSITRRATSIECLVCERTTALRTATETIRRNRDELMQAKRVLESSNQHLKEFAYAVSHDPQAPLRGIAGFTQFLQEEYGEQLDETANGYIDRIITSADRMKKLIQDLLEYSRVESQELRRRPVDLNEVLAAVLELLESEVEEAGATVTQDLLPTICCDREEIAQLLRNLISNSIKYRRETPLLIHISAQFDGQWRLSIEDNGIGIEPSAHDRIFEIFRRLHTQTEYPGSGIGLALCRKIVQRHGGRISVQSEVGQGSRFDVTLPDEAAHLTVLSNAGAAESALCSAL